MQTSKLPCKLCGNNASYIGSKDLGKGCLTSSPYIETGILVLYYTCNSCGLTYTPYFDTFTYSQWVEYIYNDEYILYDPEYAGIRAKNNLIAVPNLMSRLRIPKECSKIDYGSGSGDFAKGIGGEAYDPYSNNIRPSGKFDFITCFEVAEHHTDPISLFKDLASLLSDNGTILLTTLTLNRPQISNWYIGPRNGHCTIYNKKTLTILASLVSLIYKPLNDNTHIFTHANRNSTLP